MSANGGAGRSAAEVSALPGGSGGEPLRSVRALSIKAQHPPAVRAAARLDAGVRGASDALAPCAEQKLPLFDGPLVVGRPRDGRIHPLHNHLAE